MSASNGRALHISAAARNTSGAALAFLNDWIFIILAHHSAAIGIRARGAFFAFADFTSVSIYFKAVRAVEAASHRFAYRRRAFSAFPAAVSRVVFDASTSELRSCTFPASERSFGRRNSTISFRAFFADFISSSVNISSVATSAVIIDANGLSNIATFRGRQVARGNETVHAGEISGAFGFAFGDARVSFAGVTKWAELFSYVARAASESIIGHTCSFYTSLARVAGNFAISCGITLASFQGDNTPSIGNATLRKGKEVFAIEFTSTGYSLSADSRSKSAKLFDGSITRGCFIPEATISGLTLP